jgi:hypothetical protein
MTILIRHTHHPVYSSEGEMADGTAPSGCWSVIGRNAAGRLVVPANRYNEEDARELLGHPASGRSVTKRWSPMAEGREGRRAQPD